MRTGSRRAHPGRHALPGKSATAPPGTHWLATDSSSGAPGGTEGISGPRWVATGSAAVWSSGGLAGTPFDLSASA
jgi:hypothetical protein